MEGLFGILGILVMVIVFALIPLLSNYFSWRCPICDKAVNWSLKCKCRYDKQTRRKTVVNMYCSKCGKENADTATFCSACGNRLKKALWIGLGVFFVFLFIVLSVISYVVWGRTATPDWMAYIGVTSVLFTTIYICFFVGYFSKLLWYMRTGIARTLEHPFLKLIRIVLQPFLKLMRILDWWFYLLFI